MKDTMKTIRNNTSDEKTVPTMSETSTVCTTNNMRNQKNRVEFCHDDKGQFFDSTFTHPIVALATPRYKSALAIIRISGDGCIDLLEPFISHPQSLQNGTKKPNPKKTNPQKPAPTNSQSENDEIFSNTLDAWPANRAKYCKLQNPLSGQIIDEVMLTIYRSPHSYTGQDAADISLHGGLVAIDLLLSTLCAMGFEPGEPGEFTKRAFLNGKVDLTQAEAIHAIIEAHSVEAHNLALVQLAGSITNFIDSIKSPLVSIAAICRISLDYPDDEIQESTVIEINLIEKLLSLLNEAIASYDLSRTHREGARVVLTGLTNAGKSALYNCLLKEDRSIVSNTHGTTRDYLESPLILKGNTLEKNASGIAVRLYDTAGIRETKESIEQEGISRSHELIKHADVLLYVVDASIGMQSADYDQLQYIHEQNPTLLARTVLVWNKIDIEETKPVVNARATNTTIATRTMSKSKNTKDTIQIISNDNIAHKLDRQVRISALSFTHITTLLDAIYDIIRTQMQLLPEDLTVITSIRQKQYLAECRDALLHVRAGLRENQALDMISLDVDSALNALGCITGEVSNEEILDVMFSSFCVGK